MNQRAIEAVKTFTRAKALRDDVVRRIAEKALAMADEHAKPDSQEWAYVFAKTAQQEVNAMAHA